MPLLAVHPGASYMTENTPAKGPCIPWTLAKRCYRALATVAGANARLLCTSYFMPIADPHSTPALVPVMCSTAQDQAVDYPPPAVKHWQQQQRKLLQLADHLSET